MLLTFEDFLFTLIQISFEVFIDLFHFCLNNDAIYDVDMHRCAEV